MHGGDGAVRVELAFTTWSLDVLADGPGIMATGGGALVDELVVRLSSCLVTSVGELAGIGAAAFFFFRTALLGSARTPAH